MHNLKSLLHVFKAMEEVIGEAKGPEPRDPPEYKLACKVLKRLGTLYFREGGKYQHFLTDSAAIDDEDVLPDKGVMDDTILEGFSEKIASKYFELSAGKEYAGDEETKGKIIKSFKLVAHDLNHHKSSRAVAEMIRKYPMLPEIIDTFVGTLLLGKGGQKT